MKNNMQPNYADLIAFEKFMELITTFNPRVFLVSPRAGFGRQQFRPFLFGG